MTDNNNELTKKKDGWRKEKKDRRKKKDKAEKIGKIPRKKSKIYTWAVIGVI